MGTESNILTSRPLMDIQRMSDLLFGVNKTRVWSVRQLTEWSNSGNILKITAISIAPKRYY